MKALPLQKYGLAIAVSGAGFLVFWLSGDLLMGAETKVYVRVCLLVAAAVATGFLARHWLASDSGGCSQREIVERIPGLAWAVDAQGRLTAASTDCREYLGFVDISRKRIHPEDVERALDLWSQSLQNGEDFRSTHRVRGGDGVYRWFQAVAGASRGPKGDILGWIGTLIDIDDQKGVEETLRANESALRSILDNVPGMIATADSAGNHNYANKKNVDYFRMEQAELAGLKFLSVIHPDERDAVAEIWRQSVETGEPMDLLHRLQRHDGEYRWHRARVEPMFDAGGRVARWYGLLTDVDDQRKAEEALRASEHQLQQLADAIPTLIWSARPDGSSEFLNRRWLDYTGLSREQAEGWGWVDVLHPDDRGRLVDYWRTLLASGEPGEIEARIRRFDGAHRWFLFRADPVRDVTGSVIRWLGSNTDIDDLKRAESSLRQRERELQLLVDTMPSMVCVLTPAGEPSYVNKRLMEYIGIEQVEDLDAPGQARLSSALQSLVHPDDVSRLETILGRAFAAGEAFRSEHRVRRADGTYHWVEALGEPLRDTGGQVVAWYTVNVDVDERHKAEDALRARERELQLLIDTIPTLVWCVTPDGEPDYINKRLETYYGRKVDHAAAVDETRLDRALGRLMHPDDLPIIQRNLGHSLRTGESFCMRYRNRRYDGTYRWVDARAEPLRDDCGRIVKWYGVSIDIDDEVRAQEGLRATQERLSRAAQTASLAELSASIAHEVNQPLAAVITNSQACQRWLSVDPPNLEMARSTADRIVRSAMNAADVISRIRALFRQTMPSRAMTNLNDVIDEVCRLTMDLTKSEGVLVEADLDPALPAVPADRVQMQQVLVNLIRNGIDAMKTNGELTKSLMVASRRHGEDMILVEVRDHGEGAAELGRIFEPFFTTKQGGMGMGLAICRSILEAHEGSLWAENIDPRGTAFCFTLPICSAQAQPPRTRASSISKVTTNA
jgi:PAS domain S-box-containing protein